MFHLVSNDWRKGFQVLWGSDAGFLSSFTEPQVLTALELFPSFLVCRNALDVHLDVVALVTDLKESKGEDPRLFYELVSHRMLS